ncbi:MAG TPA: DUF4623 domain-containing protein, partial [Lacipirellulaceae bacterium]|nr:DUF4623 domain-containing protein [Lacipirellulaceae bacterium]
PGWRAPYEMLPGDIAGVDPTVPGVYNYLGNVPNPFGVNGGNLERGLAYNPVTGNLILISRNDAAGPGMSLRILDGQTGADKGMLNQGTDIITGGAFTRNMVGIADDGAIYMANLTLDTNTSPFKVYRWANESATPTVAFSGQPNGLLAGARLGDSFDVIGSGATTRLVAGYGNSPNVAGNNSFAIFDTNDNGLTFSAQHITIASNPPEAGDFRLGITFTDRDTVIGKQGNNTGDPLSVVRKVSISGSTGTLVSSFDSDGQTLRAMDYAVVDGRPLLAILECSADQSAAARARIFIYDISDLSKPIAERKIQEGSNLPIVDPENGPNQFGNGNGTGQVKFGAINGNIATIYAMSTNNGIQAFQLTLDEVAADNADFNGDGVVDGADFLIWQRGLGSSGAALADGDANGDGNVNDLDLSVWQAQYLAGGAAAAAGAVPEPTSGLLVASAVAACACLRRSRRPR